MTPGMPQFLVLAPSSPQCRRWALSGTVWVFSVTLQRALNTLIKLGPHPQNPTPYRGFVLVSWWLAFLLLDVIYLLSSDGEACLFQSIKYLHSQYFWSHKQVSGWQLQAHSTLTYNPLLSWLAVHWFIVVGKPLCPHLLQISKSHTNLYCCIEDKTISSMEVFKHVSNLSANIMAPYLQKYLELWLLYTAALI